MYLIRAISYDSALAAEVTHYWSTGGWTTRPDDTPANTVWDGRIQDPGNWEAHLFSKNKTTGRSESTAGVAKLLNLDGALDDLWKHGWGRKFEIFVGPDTATYFSEFTLLATHIATGADRSATVLTITFEDLQSVIANRLVNTTEYLGNNSGATGLEGTSSDLKGKKHPTIWGSCQVFSPPQVNSQTLMYEIGYNPVQTLTVSATGDKGQPLTYNATYGSVAALLAATTPSTKYDLYLGSSSTIAYVKLGSTPAGSVTCSAEEGTSDSTRTVAQIIKRLLLGPGLLSSGDLDLASFTALDAANSSVVGFFSATEETKLGGILDELCASIGAFWRIKPDGKVSVGIFEAPLIANSVLDVDSSVILEQDFSLSVPGDFAQGIPPYKVTVGYAKHFFVFGENDFASGVAEATKAQLIEEYRRLTPTTISGVKTKHPASEEFVLNTLLRDSSAATAMQARLASLYGTERELAVIPLHTSISGTVDLNDVISITSTRFGWSSGVAFRVIGRIHEYSASRVLLICWR